MNQLKNDQLVEMRWMDMYEDLPHTDDMYDQIICRAPYCSQEADKKFYLGLFEAGDSSKMILALDNVPLCKKHYPEEEEPKPEKIWPRYFLC